MEMLSDRTGLEHLTLDECRLLLRQNHIGRIAVTVGACPVIFPVNYAMLADDVVFRSGEGTKLQAAERAEMAAFEIDGHDEIYQTGWSVMVTGRPELLNPAEESALDALPLRPWAPGDKRHWVRIRTDRVSGRRIRPRSSS